MYDAAGGIPAISEVKFSLDEQPGLLWRLQFLRADIAPGPDRPDAAVMQSILAGGQA